MSGQSLRPSQFITTYGPGSILEGPDGPRVIPTLGNSHVFDNRQISDFEITDQRLSRALLEGTGIVRLPTNAELGLPDSSAIYSTSPFPAWSLCVRHGRLYRTRYRSTDGCPLCPGLEDHNEAWKRARREAIRFVRACRSGHLDDVDWIGIIRHNRPGCNPWYLIWEGGGGALRNVNIRCPECRASINLGQAYRHEWHCSGRFPETGYERTDCQSPARMIQRGAVNLRMPEIQSALTIPPRDSRLHQILERTSIRTVILTASPPISGKRELLDRLQILVEQGLLGLSSVREIARHPETDILDAMESIRSGIRPHTAGSFRTEEFHALRLAATSGAPSRPSTTPGAPPLFEVIRTHVRTFRGSGGHTLRVTPVSRLRVVMAQVGYRRLESTGEIVSCIFNDGDRDWVPGVELFGEGIFIDLPSDPGVNPRHFPLDGPEANSWLSAMNSPEDYSDRLQPGYREQLHPVFVWWHTLAHRLIMSLSVNSGYSSAAIRERVYVEIDPVTGDAGGGILLYTAQPGGDGTLGGLIALVPEFDSVLAAALGNIDACSNDPLCGEENFGPGKCNGAACYACLLVSETSCEHRNMLLDRNLLLRNLP